ncbi:ribonuclease P protein component [Candidatus Curtissbacteria bacterium RIFCSPHIGHO2_01_FULL_41_44]|uniref:Ribonuclease P protein component n=1 Tax=Candidatus Curtissbacteria bacterium RIFCSPLOWO2_01_FULL_42_50 TaxID=1797730 RepID=A0A1F5H680_9BACT|nr:MAG: ribonuclease P protein component [Candidatus Curtissbacteria bacterium RIFCSPHIGHO2_02_FULL_42_58]OGD93971.1 MAG: ribonuclease P protein component [Candidatus Curtissbacteria bacterium RIFCSPHIGHO2_01_FULL_41_44]OGD97577.1 MAG: ribonuclease P protein component [Candidatus Curtissbacteria bacterium RIFCSPHIGHO2_12_FULL_42_33]OGD99569.1 MAG: ribonuclease P protein component [Candidatus Curtissbacteria bacterium RIFCSPLOWO2_01_FULL_42_50]OGE02549.1 MAG: ribonuclease P protein component [Ca
MSPTRLQGQELILIVNQSHDSKTNQSWPKPKVVISKKTVKKATDRNRIKRIIRQALDSLNLKDGQITVIIKKNIANLKMEQVKQKLEDYLKI